MPLPKSANELQIFNVMVNYLKFIPNLAKHTTLLLTNSKKDAVFELQKPQLDAIENLKTLITSESYLKILDSKLQTLLRTDDSSVGLDTFLEQSYGTVDNKKWHPAGYSLQALSDYKEHAQLEQETLSLVFGIKHFHELWYGHRFIVFNDHKPLKSIFKRSIISCPSSI